MFMTEADAKRKWCPHARVIPAHLGNGHAEPIKTNPPAHNRIQEVGTGRDDEEATWHAAHNCIGSQCMAWQWLSPDQDDGRKLGYCGDFG